jgi:hypothetical protein
MFSETCQSWTLHITESCTSRTKNKDPILETEHMNRKRWSQRGSVWTSFTVCVDSLIHCTSCELFRCTYHSSLYDFTRLFLYANINKIFSQISLMACKAMSNLNILIVYNINYILSIYEQKKMVPKRFSLDKFHCMCRFFDSLHLMWTMCLSQFFDWLYLMFQCDIALRNPFSQTKSTVLY